MQYQVILSHAAEESLTNIIRWITDNDSASKAHHVLDELVERIRSLETLPERGNLVKEAAGFGSNTVREIFFKPYRIIYSIKETEVLILLVADGRRDMQTVLRNLARL